MPDCELLATCPFFNDRMHNMSEMAEMCVEQYCKGDYGWCGRYMVFKALQRGLKRQDTSLDLVWKATGQKRE